MVSSTVILVICRGASLGPSQGSKPGDVLAMSTAGPQSPRGHGWGQQSFGGPDSPSFLPGRPWPELVGLAGCLGLSLLCHAVGAFSFCCNCPFTDSFANPHVSILGLLCTAVQSLIFFGRPDLGKTNLNKSQNTLKEDVYIGY